MVFRGLLAIGLLFLASACTSEPQATAEDTGSTPDGGLPDGADGLDGTTTADGVDGTAAGDGADGSECQNECTPTGASRCQGSAVETCGQGDDDACTEWMPAVPCAPAESCSGGKCGMTCMNECTVGGATRCATLGVETCGDSDADPCLEWSQAIACPKDETCSGGVCASGCASECTAAGATRCGGNAVETCGQLDADACLEWGDGVPCSGGDTCSSGVCAGDCKDECTTQGAKACSGSGVITCGALDPDPCLEWSTPLSCPGGETCSGGACSDECASECDTVGAVHCAGNSVQSCGQFDLDQCLEWGTSVGCPETQTCSAGKCSETCIAECSSLGATECSGGGFQKCGQFDGDPCLDFGTPVACPEGETCSAGACSVVCVDECSPAGATTCSADAVQTCGNSDPDACTEWSNAVPCAASELCSAGVCSATCADECPSIGATTCDGDRVRTCAKLDSDSCLEWGTPVACPGALTCAFGSCLIGCLDECTAGSAVCSGAHVRPCIDLDADPCLDLGSPSPCDAGTTCSKGVCSATCVDECSEAGKVECVNDAVSRICKNHDADPCLEWGEEAVCTAGTLCNAGSCVQSAGPLACRDALLCRQACLADGVCALGCAGDASASAQTELQSLDACTADHACAEAACPVYFCTEESAACAFEGAGSVACIDTLDCIDECGADTGCVVACENAASAAAQHDLYRYYGCLALYCDSKDSACLNDATDSGGVCSVEFAVCLGPDDPGTTCRELTDCVGTCTDAGGTADGCEDQCLPAGSIVGQTEYFALLGCAAKGDCTEGFCLSAKCSFETATCLSNGEGDGTCPDLSGCLAKCGTAACRDACWAATELEGQILFARLVLCLQGACPAGLAACEAGALQTFCGDELASCYQ